MACTVVRRLMSRLKIDEFKIGRIEVATETLNDKSKSTKTVLMRMFKNKNIEGVTSINACYGGTAALINCINYGYSEGKDKYSIVVATDIAVYDSI